MNRSVNNHAEHDCCSVTTNVSETEHVDPSISETLITNAFASIEKQLQKLCFPGVSVLWHRDPEFLMKENCFAKAVNELEQRCPILFKVLATSLGDKISNESKAVTIGTIYGMIMHARNKQISAIQRIYTALAIQCHADNKVRFHLIYDLLVYIR